MAGIFRLIDKARIIIFSSTITPPQLTASVNDYNPTGLSTAYLVRMSADAAWEVTGIAAQESGRKLKFVNVGGTGFAFRKESLSSVAANRLLLPDNLTLTPDTRVLDLIYDGASSRWRGSLSASA